ncbi:hypothetical protein OH76DRAFT_1491045 [Lentinus brumalis]|uniref:Uncharacterized protein n=1 Tax=Lentinus brumalis TaxID=2498619 RepID=A0A371CGZ5_9APHY|nr:hypothetical protein OH76DRAFT_1491045 [Polyporus brumalis]
MSPNITSKPAGIRLVLATRKAITFHSFPIGHLPCSLFPLEHHSSCFLTFAVLPSSRPHPLSFLFVTVPVISGLCSVVVYNIFSVPLPFNVHTHLTHRRCRASIWDL